MKEISDFITVLNEAARSPIGWLLVPMLLALFGKIYLFKGWGTKLYTLCMTAITRHYDEKHKQIEVQVELELQIKALLATNNDLQSHLHNYLEDRTLLSQTLKDMTAQISTLADGLWEDRRALNGQLAKIEQVWQTMRPEGG